MSAPAQPKLMRIEAPTIFEAYTKLKRSLGESAVILKTRTYKKGGVFGIGGQKMVEIIASTGMQVPARPVRAVRENAALKKAYGLNTASPTVSASNNGAPTPTPTAQAPVARVPENGFAEDFKRELAELRVMVQAIHDSGRLRHWPELPAEFQKAFQKLQVLNIHEDIARALIHRWKSHYPDYKKGDRVEVSLIERYVSEMIVPAGPIRILGEKTTVAMLVGPTGVGKTTTIAKLAARYKLKEGLDVAFITIDTYRIAAIEQLRTYAELIGVPLKVVSTPQDMSAALDFFSDKDLVLIDTAGRSQRNRDRMEDLKQFVEASHPDELHLVVSSNIHNDVMQDTLDRFGGYDVNKLILTKLDETAHCGIVLSVVSKAALPISYITTGQEVPDDIEVVESARMARLILGLDKIHG